MTYQVSVVVRGITTADEDYLERVQQQMETIGAIDPAIVYYPYDNELAIMCEMEEETLGRLLQSEGDRAAA